MHGDAACAQSHVFRILLAKFFPGRTLDFDVQLYVCAPEYDFLNRVRA
jgi:hypothetical protein